MAVTLNSLIEALTGAVATAQAELARNQIVNLGRYFDPADNKPRVMKLTLPSMKPGDLGKDITYGVPLLSLHSPAQLRIKEVEFKFDVDLGDLGESSDTSVTVADDFLGSRREININPQPSLLGRRNTSKVILKVEAVEQSEGLVRLIGELNKMHGEFPVVDGESDGNNPPTPEPPSTVTKKS